MEDAQMRERTRSPNYPVFGLGTAIERAAALYKRDGKAAVHTSAAVQAWGYNSLNGRSLGVLGALRQFGLLEDTGAKMVRLSSVALTIHLGAPGSPERARALQDAAARPKIFSELIEQYKQTGYPSEETMVRNLTLSTSFSEDAARRVIAAFRETIDLLEAQGIADTSRDPADDPDEDEERLPPPGNTPKKRKEEHMPATEQTAGEPYDLSIALIGGALATLRVPRPMSEENYTLLTTLLAANLTAMKPALVARPPTPATPPTQEEERVS